MSETIKSNGYLVDKNGRKMEIVDAVSREQTAKNATAIGELIEEMADLKESGGSGFELVGSTPQTTTSEWKMKLVSTESAEYSLITPTVADFAQSERTFVKCESTAENGNYAIRLTESISKFTEAYVQWSVDGLVPGETYRLYVECVEDKSRPSTVVIFEHNNLNNVLGSYKPASSNWVQIETSVAEFTPPTDRVEVRLYVVNEIRDGNDSSAWLETSVNKFKNIYINRAGYGYNRTEIVNIRGMIAGTEVFDRVPAGVTILATPECEVYRAVKSYEELFDKVIEIGEKSVNLYAPMTDGWIDNATIVTSGYPEVHLQYRAKYCVSPGIPVEGGKTYTVAPALVPIGSLEAKNRIGVYDASGTTLGVLAITDNADGSMTFAVPDVAKTIRLTMRKDSFDSDGATDAAITNFNASVMIVEGTTAPDEYVPYHSAVNRLKNILLPEKSVTLETIGDDAKPVVAHLMGKTIANFGDSIFGNARPPQDVSTFLASNTGATVYNCAFGGCRMAVHTGHWDAFSMYRLAYAVANNDYSLQDEALNYDDRVSYAEVPLALMKSIDYAKLNILTIGYGTNDFTGNNPIDNEDNPLDTSTVCGALRYSIETLLTAYPNLRIFVLLPTYRFWMDSANAYADDAFDHTNNLGKTLVDYNAAIAEVAKAYNIPVIDNFAELGINKLNRAQYFPATDGTHHNATGRKLLADHIAHKLW